MAFKFVSLSLLFGIISVVIARDCNNETSILNCDDCFRCGGTWCYDKQIPECKIGNEDNICSLNRENISAFAQPGSEQIVVQKSSRMNVDFVSTEQFTPTVVVTNSTQSDRILAEFDDPFCQEDICRVTLEVTPKTDFCLENGGAAERFSLTVTYDKDVKVLNYQVPCACACSSLGERNATRCSGHGDYKCGVCLCHDGWQGRRCEREKCPSKTNNRGDIPDCTKDSDCHSNGECHCEQCRCNMQLEGSRYFDNQCRDICSVTGEMDSYITNLTTSTDVILVPYNETMLNETDRKGLIWIRCSITVNNCLIEYATKKEGEMYWFMNIKDCQAEAAATVAGGVTLQLPIILGIIAVLGSAAAVAGYMVWKNRMPPVPLSDPEYQNIGADYCQGENPLYKPPTSSFKNPTYGKV